MNKKKYFNKQRFALMDLFCTTQEWWWWCNHMSIYCLVHSLHHQLVWDLNLCLHRCTHVPCVLIVQYIETIEERMDINNNVNSIGRKVDDKMGFSNQMFQGFCFTVWIFIFWIIKINIEKVYLNV